MYLIRGKEASPDEVKAFDVSLILYAEHEYNASTFTARVDRLHESRPALRRRRLPSAP